MQNPNDNDSNNDDDGFNDEDQGYRDANSASDSDSDSSFDGVVVGGGGGGKDGSDGSGVRDTITCKVSLGEGYVKITLKHSGSLLLWCGYDRGGGLPGSVKGRHSFVDHPPPN